MSESRAALARTYRPRRFREMATQEHVSDTLRTAVARGRVAHAYLFCGPRGVGKTTAARVLAMALNCPDRSSDGEPCSRCESCERIWAGRTSLDVIEIDAASNRGVDDARDLRERAMYAPTDEHRYKIYIIDEAHMLTREAWNALLKILEEPPPRVIFVFATTEPQKIQQAAPPILSRCQRFDFRRIPVPAIVDRLGAVLAAENIQAEPGVLVPIARRAEGGLRDALSLLDQVLSFAAPPLTEADVRRVLGIVGDEFYLELLDIIADRRYGDVFRFVQRLVDEGFDLAEFQRGLADMLRSLLAAKFDGAVGPDVREDLGPAYVETAGRFGTGDLVRMLALVAELDVEGKFRKSTNPRTMLESLLLRFAYLDRTLAIEELIAAGAGGGPGESGPRSATPHGAPAPAPARRPDSSPASSAPSPPATPRPARPADPDPSAAGPGNRGRPSPPAATRADDDEAQRALQRIVRRGTGLPNGILLFLSAASARTIEAGHVVIEVPPGPGLERLAADESTKRALAAALGSELGRPTRLEVRERGGQASGERLTHGAVRSEQLARLTRSEPTLGSAVEAWDLELME